MDSQPWWHRQGERFDPDDDDRDQFGPPADPQADTMSFQVFTNRLPYQQSDLPASPATTTRAAPTQGSGSEEAEETGSSDDGGENAAASTFTTPVRCVLLYTSRGILRKSEKRDIGGRHNRIHHGWV